LEQVASVLDIGRKGCQSGLAALVFGPCDGCPSIPNLCLVKHPLQWLCVDLSVPFHLLGWHRLALLHFYRLTALMAENALIFDQFV
jgi:hypothetical protein